MSPRPHRGAATRKRNLFGLGGGRKVMTADEIRELQKETADSHCRHGDYKAAQRTVRQSPKSFARGRGLKVEGAIDRAAKRARGKAASALESLASKIKGNPDTPDGDLTLFNPAADAAAPPSDWYRLSAPALEALRRGLADPNFYHRESPRAPAGRQDRDLVALDQAIEAARDRRAVIYVAHDHHGWYVAEEDTTQPNPGGIEFVIGRPKGRTTTEVQSVLFDARLWNVEQAKRWLRDNGFAAPQVDRGGARAHELRFRQLQPSEFQSGSFRTIPAGRHVAGAHRRGRGRRNPEDEAEQAAELFETFQGRAPQEILELHRQQVERKDYAKLGDLVSLTVLGPKGRECKFEFPGDDVIVASSANAHQLYLLGGNQDIRALLSDLDIDASKDFIEVGPCVEIEYFSHKALDHFEPVRYYHRFGEETKDVPVLAFDQLNLQMILVGGAYEVKAEGIVN